MSCVKSLRPCLHGVYPQTPDCLRAKREQLKRLPRPGSGPDRFRAKREQLESFQGPCPESPGKNLALSQGQNLALQGQNPALTVLYVPCLLNSRPENTRHEIQQTRPPPAHARDAKARSILAAQNTRNPKTRLMLSERGRGDPQKDLRGVIPDPYWEPLTRTWSHFGGIYRQKLTESLKFDF